MSKIYACVSVFTISAAASDDICEPYFTAAKLATRIHRNPATVVNSYIRGKFSGNILDILEPQHNIYPYVIENGDPLRLVKIEEV